ncbi:hypothetical protein GQ457_08G019090 [Hibiscus cannabinus]
MRPTPRVPSVRANKVVRELRLTPRVPCVGAGKVVRELRPTPRVPCVGAGKVVRELRPTPRVPCVGAGKVVRELRPTPRVPCVGAGKVVRELRPTPRVPCVGAGKVVCEMRLTPWVPGVGAGKLESVRGKRLTDSAVALVIGVSAQPVCRLILFFSITYWRPLRPVQLRRRHQYVEVTDTHLPKYSRCGRHSLPVGRTEHSQEPEDRKGTGRDNGMRVMKSIIACLCYECRNMLAKAKYSDDAAKRSQKGARCFLLEPRLDYKWESVVLVILCGIS